MSLYYFRDNYSHPVTGQNLQPYGLTDSDGLPEEFKGFRFLLQALDNNSPALCGSEGTPQGWGNPILTSGGSGQGNIGAQDWSFVAVQSGGNSDYHRLSVYPTQIREHKASFRTFDNAFTNSYYYHDYWGLRDKTAYAEFINMTSTDSSCQDFNSRKGFHGLCWDPMGDGGAGCTQNSNGYHSGTAGCTTGGGDPCYGARPPSGPYQHYILVDYSNDTEYHDPTDWKFFLQNIFNSAPHFDTAALQNAVDTLGVFPTLTVDNIPAQDAGKLDYYIEMVAVYDHTNLLNLNPELDNFDFIREDNGEVEQSFGLYDRFDHFVNPSAQSVLGTTGAVSQVDRMVIALFEKLDISDPAFANLTMDDKKKRVWISKEPLPLLRESYCDGESEQQWERTVPWSFFINHWNGTWDTKNYGLDDNSVSTSMHMLFHGHHDSLYYGFPHLMSNNQGCNQTLGCPGAVSFVNPQWNLIVTNGTSTHQFGDARCEESNTPMGEGAILMNYTISNYGITNN